MEMLKQLLILAEKSDAFIPEDKISEIESNIRKGAKDKAQNWKDAIHLTNRAFEVAGVQVPTPAMRDAWKAYEECIAVAVKELSKYRGLDGDWRYTIPK